MNGNTGIASVLDGVTPASFENEDQRIKTLLAAYALVARLETPWETTARLCMGQVCCSFCAFASSHWTDGCGLQLALGAALKVCKDLGLFEKWHEVGDKPMTAEELAKLVPCEAALLGKIPEGKQV